MVNTTVGAGILGLPGRAFALSGTWCLCICLAAAVLMALVATVFAEVASRFARTGGIYLFIAAAFGVEAGLIVGWATLVARLLSFATIANLALDYLAALVPALRAGAARVGALAAVTLAMSVPLWRGVKLSAVVHNIFSAVKLLLLTGFVLVCLPLLWRDGLTLTPPPAAGQLAPALTLMLFGLLGLEGAVVANGEARAPGRDVPFGLFVGLAAATLLYLGVLLAAMVSVPDLAHSTRPVFDGAVRVAGPAAGAVVVVAGAISMCGVLFVTLFAGPRNLFALAQDGQIPAVLGRLHPRFGTPHVAIAVNSLLGFLLAANSSFLGAVTGATLMRLLLYAGVAAAALALRRRGYSETPAPFVPRLGPVAAGATIALCLALLTQIHAAEAHALALYLLPAVPLWLWRRRTVAAQARAGQSGPISP